jgi:hypothetical protein
MDKMSRDQATQAAAQAAQIEFFKKAALDAQVSLISLYVPSLPAMTSV